MKKLVALAIGCGLGVAAVSGPALANPYIVENDLDNMIFAGCGSTHSVAAGRESGILHCPADIRIRRQPGGVAVIHAHNCDDEKPVHRIEVTASGTASPTDVNLGMAFSHTCEAETS